ncbi:hypothetical protein H0H93_009948 [Arthromyces matolae]|nr:hypothetical protein H0H93_009948 [Arthromyces matolae]
MAPLLKTKDGVDLSCYLLPQTTATLSSSYQLPGIGTVTDERVELTPGAAGARATVIVFHGNAMHNWQCFEPARRLFKMKCNVFLLSYRGFSFSGGKPTEAGLRIDAQTALDYILSQPYLADVPIILYGHSLGGGVAIDLASRNPSRISGLLVSNTFTSIPDIVRSWPVIGNFSFLCTQKWRSADKMRLIPTSTPILMISGRSDQVVPPQLMDKLWDAAQKRGVVPKPKFNWPQTLGCSAQDDTEPVSDPSPQNDSFVTVESGTHGKPSNTPPLHLQNLDGCTDSTMDTRRYWRVFQEFIEKFGAKVNENVESSSIQTETPSTKSNDRRWRYEGATGLTVEA